MPNKGDKRRRYHKKQIELNSIEKTNTNTLSTKPFRFHSPAPIENTEIINSFEQLLFVIKSKVNSTWSEYLKLFDEEKLKNILLSKPDENLFDAMQEKFTGDLRENLAIYYCYLVLYSKIRKREETYTTGISILNYRIGLGFSKEEKKDGIEALDNFIARLQYEEVDKYLDKFEKELNKEGTELKKCFKALTTSTILPNVIKTPPRLPKFVEILRKLPEITAKKAQEKKLQPPT